MTGYPRWLCPAIWGGLLLSVNLHDIVAEGLFIQDSSLATRWCFITVAGGIIFLLL
jgi:hypothetical protein